jgi:hypothetical protein
VLCLRQVGWKVFTEACENGQYSSQDADLLEDNICNYRKFSGFLQKQEDSQGHELVSKKAYQAYPE